MLSSNSATLSASGWDLGVADGTPFLPWIGPLKVLSVNASPGNLESANWRPRRDEI